MFGWCLLLKINAILLTLLAASALGSTPAVSAEKAVLIDTDGRILYEKNADEQALIASTTKLATAIVAYDNLDMDSLITVPNEACCVEGTRIYLSPGQKITVRKLLEGLLLASGNDAALALAMAVDGGISSFVELMNEKAIELGMYSTHFSNPHGLDGEDHFSTARDLAALMAEFVRYDELVDICGQSSADIDTCVFANHNKLIKLYPQCIAGKTGYTAAAGRCLVSCAENKGRRLICVTLSASDDWNDHIKLFDWGFAQ